jgi:hypothetical protein
VLSELPYPPDRVLTDEEWAEVVRYNGVYLGHTWDLLERLTPELQALAVLSSEQQVDLRSTPSPRVVERVFLNAYGARHGNDPRKPPDPDAVRFAAQGGVVRPTTPAAAEWFDRVTSEQLPVVNGSPVVPKMRFPIGRLTVQVGAGWLHSVDKPRVHYASRKHPIELVQTG